MRLAKLTNRGANPTNMPVIKISLLDYPGAQQSALGGLNDLLTVADDLARRRQGQQHAFYEISTLRFLRGDAAVLPEASDIVILPPCLGDSPTREGLEPLLTWLKTVHARGATLASVCAGAFLLGEAGLLNGRPITTHWVLAHELATRFPEANVDADQLLIDDGNLITAGGLMAWTDLGLLIVERLLGAPAMIETARFLLVDPPGRQQRFYSSFLPRRDHGDEAILRAQAFLDKHAAGPLTVPEMAAAAKLEERTFLRRFRAATGLRPIEYCQHLRIAKAREMLETSRRPVEQVGWDVGYADPASFRKLFLKLTGLTPTDYRQRFGAAQRG